VLTEQIQIISTHGSGRTFVVLYEHGCAYEQDAKLLAEKLAATAKVLVLASPVVSALSWQTISRQLEQLIDAQKIRQASYICFGDTGVLAQHLYLRTSKLVRSLLLIDASSSPHPTRTERFIDSLEAYFPLGLPLRSESKTFNARSHLQRIRCPVLRVATSKATFFLKDQSMADSIAMPTAWFCDIAEEYPQQDESTVLALIAEQFQEIPAKCPQGS
jgi:hypothetical protein